MAKLSSNAEEIARARYFQDGEDWQQLSIRCGNEAARAESREQKKRAEEFSEIIYNMDFLPAGRILRNLGRLAGSLFNCYVIPIDDSIEEIGQFFKEALTIWSGGGGIGTNFSFLRPNGAPIKGKGGSSSGPISFMKAIDAAAATIESGGQRRAAGMGMMNVRHPDIMKFIDAKTKDKILSYFNISVAVTNSFIDAVDTNSDWDLKFNQQIYDSVPARDIWTQIVENMVKHAEPGILHWDNMRSNNSYYFAPVISTNPCVVGDTLIATADGRNAVSIKQLAEEGRDVPVYCLNETTQNLEIKMGRRPRKTGVKKEVWKVILDDGSEVRATPNHKFILNDGRAKRLDELRPGDSLRITTKQRIPEDKFKSYWHFINDRKFAFEHRLIYNFNNPNDIYKFGNKEVIHHKDFNKLNNESTNLVKMTTKEHDKYHGECIKGEKNPYHRMSNKWKYDFASKPGEKNPRYKGISPERLFDLCVEHTKEKGRQLYKKEWIKIIRDNDYPNSRYSLGKYQNKTTTEYLTDAAIKAGCPKLSKKGLFHYNRYVEEIHGKTDLGVYFDFDIEEVMLYKKCECCGEAFVRTWDTREVCFCSRECSSKGGYTKQVREQMAQNDDQRQEDKLNKACGVYNDLKFELRREPMKKEFVEYCSKNSINCRMYLDRDCTEGNNKFSWKILVKAAKDFNPRLVGIDFVGYEDVYNITVDDNHNFAIQFPSKSEKNKYYQVFTQQCGEATLEKYGICNLGSIVLPRFVSNINTNWKKMEDVIRKSVRFLDNIIDVNNYVLPEFDISAHNGRRIGLGVMGLADYLLTKQIRYGSQKSLQEIEKLMRFIRDVTYSESIQLSIEKGAFPKFDSREYGKAHFIRSLPASTRMDIKKHGIRNVTSLAIAPTGTISLVADVNSGIEPLLAKAYKRSDRVSERYYIHPLFEKFVKEGKSLKELPEWFVDSFDLEPSDHLDVQVAVQKYVDGAVSKTINMPKGTTTDQLSELMLEYIHDLKGCTVYVDGSREGQPIQSMGVELATKQILEENYETKLEEGDVTCASGKCEI